MSRGNLVGSRNQLVEELLPLGLAVVLGSGVGEVRRQLKPRFFVSTETVLPWERT